MNYDVYNVLSPERATNILETIKDMEWAQGKARSEKTTEVYKHNLELKGENEEVLPLLQELQTLLAHHYYINLDHSPKKFLIPKFNRYDSETQGTYHRHGDSAMMGGKVRTDLACTIFLTPPEDYEGGELCIEDVTQKIWSLKPEQGQCVVYPCYQPHWVEPVTKGSRISAITWIESRYRDQEQRELIRWFARTLRDMEDNPRMAYTDQYTTLGTILGKLTRMWVDPI